MFQRRKGVLRILAWAVAISFVSFAQSFETVSITQDKSGGPPGELRTQRDGLTGTNVTLRQLIQFAYELPASRLSGPSWIETERYDVAVKDTSGSSKLEVRMQTVLSDRFKLKFHHETKEIPVYFLVIAKGGVHLVGRKEGHDAFEARAKGGASPFKPGLMAIFKPGDLAAFAERLGRPLDRPIVDKTGVKGEYWFQLEWAPDPGPDAVNVGPSLLTALRDQLGLDLEPQRAAQDVLVIDQAVSR
jgi:uncharacterized protein (TIGR03435 family)